MKKKLLIAAVALMAVIQFVPAAPPKSNPRFDPSRSFVQVMKPPSDVSSILKRACYDCHSNETKWPAYSYVAPVSWVVQKHVADGRKLLNFSEWLLPAEQEFTDWSGFEKICTEVNTGNMPIAGYVKLHPEAALTESDNRTICGWVNDKMPRPK
jgi:cytochrome c551/c552